MHWAELENWLYFLLCLVRYTFFGIKVISTLSSITYKNIGKPDLQGPLHMCFLNKC